MHIYLVAFNTNSVESLARAKLKFSAATNAYINKTDDQLQFPAAAVQDGYKLHGIFTEQGAESMNSASINFRRANAALSVLQGMVELRAKHHLERDALVNSLGDDCDIVPPSIRKRLNKIENRARATQQMHGVAHWVGDTVRIA